MNRYIAIDPGDRWVGYARLVVSIGADVIAYSADMGVIKRDLNLIYVVDRLIPKAPYTVIVENFQNRPVGFNKFSSGATLKLIGAMQYVALKNKVEWVEVNPSRSDLDKLYIGKYLKQWNKLPPGEWQHAFSAWRAMANWMLKTHNEDLSRLRFKARKLTNTSYGHTDRVNGVTAPTMIWEIDL